MEHRSHKADFLISTDSGNLGNKRFKQFTPNVAHIELLKEKQVGGALNCSDLELCTYLLALGEGYLPTFYSDINQSVRLSGMSIASKSYQQGKKTVCFRGFQSLEMSNNLTADRGEELLMSYLAGFRARTSAQPEKAQGLTESDQGCGEKWRGSFARYDPATHSLRTHQCSLFEDLTECCVTLPQWGLMRRGECWEQQTLAQTIRGTGFGLSPDGITTFHTPNTTGLDGGSNSRRALKKRMKSWPTPQANDNRDRGSAGSGAVQRRMAKGKQIMLSQSVDQNSGQLNPTWVERLMGWPDDWTALRRDDEAEERTGAQDVSTLRSGNDSTAMGKWKVGQFVCSEKVLQYHLCWLSRHREALGGEEKSAAFNATPQMQSLRRDEWTSETPQRQKSAEQHSIEHRGFVPEVPCRGTQVGRHLGPWGEGWEEGVARVSNGVKARSDRLKAIGNGQVPLCAATAWKILSGELA